MDWKDKELKRWWNVMNWEVCRRKSWDRDAFGGGCTQQKRNSKGLWKLLKGGERANTHPLSWVTTCLELPGCITWFSSASLAKENFILYHWFSRVSFWRTNLNKIGMHPAVEVKFQSFCAVTSLFPLPSPWSRNDWCLSNFGYWVMFTQTAREPDKGFKIRWKFFLWMALAEPLKVKCIPNCVV